jgi:hypothetical protein
LAGCIIVGNGWLSLMRELTDLAESGLEKAGRALNRDRPPQQPQPQQQPVLIDDEDEPPLAPPKI